MTTPVIRAESSAFAIVNRLAAERRALIEVKEKLVNCQAAAATHKVEVVNHLLALTDGVIPGKTDADRQRVIDNALSEDGHYPELAEWVRQAQREVTRVETEVTVLSEFFAAARLQARLDLADALRGSGTKVEDL